MNQDLLSPQLMLEGAIAVVTGASGGMGLGICAALAERKVRIVALDISEEKANAAVKALASQGWSDAIGIAADVGSASSVASAFAEIDRRVGPASILINNAGIREIKNIFDLTPEEWDQVVSINLSGPFYCSREAALRMREAGGGSIVNIASVAGLVAIRARPAYVATKHGLVGLTRNLSFDLAPYKIRVNAVAPGLIKTPLTEAYFSDQNFVSGLEHAIALRDHGVPADVGQAVAWLCSPDSRYITGITLPIDGGFMAEKSFATKAAASFVGKGAQT